MPADVDSWSPADSARDATSSREIALLAAGTALLAILSRLPFLLDASLSIDGDEAILGLAAQQLLEGRALPVFFPGQRYGFSLLEAAAGAASFGLFGVSEVALRGAMLLLWTIGAVLLVLAVREVAGRRAAWLAIVLVVACPAWGLWSTKARGGYVTAFLLTGLVLYVAAHASRRRDGAASLGLLLGACAGLLLFSQPLWLLGVGPLLALLAWERRGAWALALAAAFGVTSVALYTVSLTQTALYSPGLLVGADLGRALLALPERTWVSLGGMHVSVARPEIGPLAAAAAWVWCALLIAVLGAAGVGLARRRRLDAATALAAGMLLVLASSLAMGTEFAFRYLLPIAAPVAVAVAIGWGSVRALRSDRATALAAVAIAGLGLGAFFDQATLGGARHAEGGTPEPALVRALVADLEESGIAHVYSSDPLFQWNLMFTSHGRILARWVPATDRMPEIPLAVDRALWQGRPTALVGLVESPETIAEQMAQLRAGGHAVRLVRDRFLILERPSAALLESVGFALNASGDLR